MTGALFCWHSCIDTQTHPSGNYATDLVAAAAATADATEAAAGVPWNYVNEATEINNAYSLAFRADVHGARQVSRGLIAQRGQVPP